MIEEELFNEIKRRKSTRLYDLSDDSIDFDEIEKFIENVKPLDDSIEYELKIVKSNLVNQRFMKEAPYYIAAFSEIKENYLINIGFILEQIDLFLSSKNIASCWQAIPEPKKELSESSNLEFVVFLAFGKSDEPIHRDSSQFIRKDLSQISDVDGLEDVMDIVRYTPSSVNSQPWYFAGNEGSIDVYCKNPSLRDKLTRVNLTNQIDMGIVLLIFSLALIHENKFFTIDLRRDFTKNLKDYHYIANITIE